MPVCVVAAAFDEATAPVEAVALSVEFAAGVAVAMLGLAFAPAELEEPLLTGNGTTGS